MASAAPLRLFIALWPQPPVRDAVVQWQAQWTWPVRASIVAPERLHVTLHFLGAVAPSRVLDLRYVLQRITTPKFDVHFGKPDMWSHGMAVLRPDSTPTALRGLQGRIGLALAEIGMQVEARTYRPHITLARRASGATPPATLADIAWPAHDGFVLVQTLPGGRGYEVIERFS